MHLASVSLPLAGIAVGLFRQDPRISIMILGLAAGMFSTFEMDIQALKHHAIFMKLIRTAKGTKIVAKGLDTDRKTQMIKDSNLKIIFIRYINPFYENYLVMQIITLAAIFNNLYWVILFYGISFPIMWLIKLVHEYRIGTKDYDFLFKPYKK